MSEPRSFSCPAIVGCALPPRRGIGYAAATHSSRLSCAAYAGICRHLPAFAGILRRGECTAFAGVLRHKAAHAAGAALLLLGWAGSSLLLGWAGMLVHALAGRLRNGPGPATWDECVGRRVSPSRGVIVGGGKHELSVAVDVTPLKDGTPAAVEHTAG